MKDQANRQDQSLSQAKMNFETAGYNQANIQNQNSIHSSYNGVISNLEAGLFTLSNRVESGLAWVE